MRKYPAKIRRLRERPQQLRVLRGRYPGKNSTYSEGHLSNFGRPVGGTPEISPMARLSTLGCPAGGTPENLAAGPGYLSTSGRPVSGTPKNLAAGAGRLENSGYFVDDTPEISPLARGTSAP